MSVYLEMLRQIAEELWVSSSSEYTHRSKGTISPKSTVAAEKKPYQNLIKALAHFIYLFYNLNDSQQVTRLLTTEVEEQTPIMMREDTDFRQQLHEANQGHGYISSDWEVVLLEDGGIAVVKDGLQLFASSEDIVATHPSNLVLGDNVGLRFPKDLPYVSAGYYGFVSNAGSTFGSDPIVRLYFHATAMHAHTLIARLTSMLLPLQIKYTGKILNHPSTYTRPDALVLYIAREDFDLVSNSLEAIYPEIAAYLKPSTPRFAKYLAPGIGLAEESNASSATLMSFGQHRSRLAAQGLVQAFTSAENTADQRYNAILQAFREEGLDAARPYLDVGSIDRYSAFETFAQKQEY